MEFRHSFVVDAPVEVVAAFHADTSALKRLTPLPIIAQLHEYEPLANGSRARFTLWFGPIPVRWHAVHSDVSTTGFTDTQVSGPLRSWQHTHRFVPLGPAQTRVDDTILYEHHTGWRGLLSRMLFSHPGLLYLFTARKLLTRRGVGRLVAARPDSTHS
jgi:ligand-binding SRPBCC domain-containing protein